MKGFILGLAVGALGVYAALKLSNDDTREELYSKANKVAGRAKDELDYGIAIGKSKALRAGVIARQEVRKGKQKVNQTAGELAGKIADELSDFEAKANARAAGSKA